MDKIQEYVEKLKKIENWETYLMQESGLPGPRVNIKLVQAVAEVGTKERFLSLLSYTSEKAPINTPEEFLAFCGTLGLGKLIEGGEEEYLERLRLLASDPRWRTREAVAMALQLYGEKNMDNLIKEMEQWTKGSNYEKRAVAAALCEPRLLKQKEQVSKVLIILDEITDSIMQTRDRKDEGFKALKKGMGYCWSVAIVAYPDKGKKMFEKWGYSTDKEINWIIKENLRKKRLDKMDKKWTEFWNEKIMG